MPERYFGRADADIAPTRCTCGISPSREVGAQHKVFCQLWVPSVPFITDGPPADRLDEPAIPRVLTEIDQLLEGEVAPPVTHFSIAYLNRKVGRAPVSKQPVVDLREALDDVIYCRMHDNAFREPDTCPQCVDAASAPQEPAQSLPTSALARKELPLTTGLLDYFPAALIAVAGLSRIGNEQHNPGQPMHWARGKSGDEADALLRHLVDRGAIDTDGIRHSTKVAWRALALLQKELEAEGLAPISRGSQ